MRSRWVRAGSAMLLSGPKTASGVARRGHATSVSPLDPDVCYRALVARDARFDGLFFVGVKTTGIYCRPICRGAHAGPRALPVLRDGRPGRAGRLPLLLPLPARAGARRARPWTRCRAWSRAPCAASMKARCPPTARVDDLARELGRDGPPPAPRDAGRAGRQPGRAGASRGGWRWRGSSSSTRALPMTEVAFASGFRSVRRFNAAVKARYARPPSAMRREGAPGRRRGGQPARR